MITVNVFDLTRKKMLIHAIKIENRRKKTIRTRTQYQLIKFDV